MRMCLLTLHFPAVLLGTIFSATGFAQSLNSALAEMNAALQAGEADHALALASSLPGAGANNAEVQNIECRVRFTLQQWDIASKACKLAVDLDAENSSYHMWLGRALGEKAAHASFLSAFSLSKQVRAEFEEAVSLNPRSPEALADLGEFYRDAPGVVGGGLDKAEGIAQRLDAVEPPRAHQLRAGIAEERKDYLTAEQELKQAIAASAHPAFEWTVLASFYERRQQWSLMESAIHNCVSAATRDKTAGVALYDGAGVLIRAKRDPELAAKMLKDYLASRSITEEAPAFVAHYRLARLLDQLDDSEGARREQVAGYAMAHEYRPPQDTKH